MPFTNATALYVREVEALFWTTTSAEAEAGARSHAFVQVKQKSGTSCTPPPNKCTSFPPHALCLSTQYLTILLIGSLEREGRAYRDSPYARRGIGVCVVYYIHACRMLLVCATCRVAGQARSDSRVGRSRSRQTVASGLGEGLPLYLHASDISAVSVCGSTRHRHRGG